MGIAERIREVLEFYRDAGPQAVSEDNGDRAAEILDAIAGDDDDGCKLQTLVSFAETQALGDGEDPAGASEVLLIVQEFAE